MQIGRTELLYLRDSYLSEFHAEVVGVGEDYVVLDRTAFHPRGGGLVSDTGTLFRGSEVFQVLGAEQSEEGVRHMVDRAGLEVGDRVRGALDWSRRYRLMRMHTALHVLVAIVNSRTGALITGNQVEPDSSRVDFNLEKMDRALIEECVAEANRRLAEGHEIRIRFIEREEALKIPELVKLAAKAPPEAPILRIVEIGEIDAQLDGGPHVKNTSEVGRIVMKKIENKGKSNRRLYFTLDPP
ncbi:Alanine--tRNA ligase [Candidatus Calditenuaceae archaeon HR02]|nr:Alanine--tRNA ligase [Candidatus Calditenuaceae archaeon HR02]